MSLFPIALIACKLTPPIKEIADEILNICTKGTANAHFDVNKTLISGPDAAARPNSIGNITKDIIFTAFRVISLTRIFSSLILAIAGKSTDIMDVLIFVVINAGS